MRAIVFHRRAARYLSRMPRDRAIQVRDALREFVALDEISNHPNLKQMGGNMAGWSRLQTGSYRAICSADPGAGWRACPPGSHFRKDVRAV